MDELIVKKLINVARENSLKNFCCPHTRFSVGAALLTDDGTIFGGFNIENAGIMSICGERVAFTKALSEGHNKFKAIAVMGKSLDTEVFKKVLPCGYCRQFMIEYADYDLLIYTYDEEEEILYSYTLKELLPESYKF